MRLLKISDVNTNGETFNLAHAQEAERKRIARDLHDVLGQNIAALRMGLTHLKEALAADPHVVTKISELEDLASEMGQRVHYLALELRPASLDDIGLFPSIAAFVELWSIRFSIKADCQNTLEDEISLGSLVDSALYRIVQEALTNVAKHSRCTHVDVILQRHGDQLIIVVEDNGCGFDIGLLRLSGAENALGIQGMKERASMAGANLDIESAKGKGTTVIVRVPLGP